MSNIIDTHAHIYDEAFVGDQADMISRAQAAGVQRIYMPNIDTDSIALMLKMEEQYSGICIPMMGIHPCYIDAGFREALSTAEAWLGKRAFCAIGEIGIDLYWDKTYIAEQEEAFIIQLNWAKELQIPVAIHCRESLDLVLDLVKINQDGRLNGIFHCFTGDANQAETIKDLGFLMGIGGVVTFKNSGLDAVLSTIGLDNMVLETDSPYLAPTPHRGKRNEPAYLDFIVKKVAHCLECPEEEVRATTSGNANKLFNHA
ncbi:MAG: TatD family hydrolase [Cyclobacteriaceae bacterium]|nr:TatD family hydrolase [Cyclobacteriaceae bacterium]